MGKGLGRGQEIGNRDWVIKKLIAIKYILAHILSSMRKLLFIIYSLLLVSCSESPRFRLMDSKHTGIDFQNTITETDSFNILTYEYIYNGAGVGAGDLNNDGLTDLVFAGNQVCSRIYLNMGKFKFRDITSNLKGITNDQWFSGVALADINTDGWLDIYLTSTAGNDPVKCRNRLWINEGAGKGKDPVFTEHAGEYGIDNTDHSVAAAFFDYDLDGYPDLYILNNLINPEMTSAYRNKIVDGSALNNDRLYRNNGNGTFTDVTKLAGIVYEGFGTGLAIGDVNKDSFPDIYISNDLISNDLLYINQGNGTFLNEIGKYISYQSRTSKGNDIADINNDGNPEIFTLDVMPEAYYKKKQTINGFNYLFYVNDDGFGFEHQYLRNMLHLHNGFLNGTMLPFSETGQIMGIYQTGWSWSSLFADYDNDGDKDLLITNGFPRDITDKDWTRLKVKAAGTLASDKLLAEMAPVLKIPNVAFENTGDLRFVKKTDWLPDILSCSYGASLADLDNDGDLDYIVNNINDEAFVLRNMTSEQSAGKSNFVKIRLTGLKGNTLALGAKTEIWTNNKYQYSEHFLTRGYASSVDPVIHFGLAGHNIIDSIKITWPGGRNISLLRNIKANQTIEIIEKNSLQSGQPIKASLKSDLLLTRCDSVVDYFHEQADFNDFSLNQKIIPHKFSQVGPRMAKGDIDNDGHEDMIIGSTNTMPTTILLRKGNRFKETRFEGLTTQKGFSESDLAILDIDGDGDNDVIALAGGYENSQETEYKHYLYENNNNNTYKRINLPIPQFPASVIRPCDYDHDGNIDLFIGGRVKPGIFPYSNHSWLIHNDKGKLSVNPSSRLNLGLVTDALWNDYDNDGWEDLLVAREWNSIVILKNMNGKELVPQILPELEGKHGLWYSLIAGDFDRDGDDDYIAGNLGENHRFTVNDQYPLNLYAIDLERDGTIDPIITAYWKSTDGKMTEYPVNYLDELWSQSALLETKYKDYTSFSYLSFKELVDENILKKLEFSLYVNTTSSYILWNDRGSFRFQKLPALIQFSPLKKMIVKDLNGDDWPDVLAGGNDYTYDLSSGYFDANKGLILINKGKNPWKGEPAFEVLKTAESGLLLQGMVESLLWFDGDTSLVVAGINRAKAVVFEINQ